MLRDGLKAATVRVNDIDGVGGFVLPGDHVDVSLTRQIDKSNATSEVVLQNVRVLGIDVSKYEGDIIPIVFTINFKDPGGFFLAVTGADGHVFGADALKTAELVKNTVNRLSRNLPPGWKVAFPIDSTLFIKLSVEEVVITLVEAIVQYYGGGVPVAVSTPR